MRPIRIRMQLQKIRRQRNKIIYDLCVARLCRATLRTVKKVSIGWLFCIVTSENDGQGVRKKERGINSRKYWTSFSLHAIL